MSNFQVYLDHAEVFINQAQRADVDAANSERQLTAAILFWFIALESFVNDMMSDFVSLPPELFTPHELGILKEKAVELSDSGNQAGKFVVTNQRRYWDLESKILFLVARFGSEAVDRGGSLWQRFKTAKEIRDRLTHPRKSQEFLLSSHHVVQTHRTVKEVIELIATKVWGKEVQW